MRNIILVALLITGCTSVETADTTEKPPVVVDTSIIVKDTLTDTTKCDTKIACDSTKF